MIEVLGIVLAGGKGERLYPLTKDRAKPAVPFGGKYRIVDFVLSNLVNSGIYSIYVLTQFKSQSLIEHLDQGWRLSDFLQDRFITAVPAQMRTGHEWYQGTADSVFQNLYLVQRHHPDLVAVFGADHIYRMNVGQMIREHRWKGALVTVAVLPVPIDEATNFGVIEVDEDWRIIGFDEKPSHPKPIPGEPTQALVSMGNYIFDTNVLIKSVTEDSLDAQSSHDFGHNVLPSLVSEIKVYAYDFRKNRIPMPLKQEEPSYWRDVGSIETFYEANMDLRAVDPAFNLYNHRWPIRTVGYGDPPAKFVFDEDGRRGFAVDSVVGEGTIISGSVVRGSIIGRNVRIHSYCTIEDSILMDWVEVGRGCRIRRTIVDKHNIIPPGTEVGYNHAEDARRHFMADGDIVVIARGQPKSAWMLTTP
jgi:glucose-1-phosphate adenylyltransferase